MPNGRSANVRSHRRGGGRRRTSPWLVIGIVLVLVLSGLTVGWTYLVRRACSGSAVATIDASPNIAPILSTLQADWAKTKPAVGGTCVSVNVIPKDSALMATALGNPWDTQANGPAPDVWVPESSVWIRQASVSPAAEQLMPDLQPSLARSPDVIAMPRDMATALGWPNSKFDWPDILTDEKKSNFWTSQGKPWGKFKFTMTDPQTSTAGMLALMSIADANNDGSVDNSEESDVFSFAGANHQVGDTTDVLAGLSTTDKQSATSAAVVSANYVSAFPALEQDVIHYNEGDPKEQLVAVYPKSGSYDADHPYLILNKPSWGTAASLAAATAFEQYARSPAARTLFLEAGFRDSNRAGDASFVQANGVIPSLNGYLPRSVLVPESVTDTMQAWTAVTRQTNVLLVLDTSGSMLDLVPGTGKTRLQLAQAAARQAVLQLGDGLSDVGLWQFSTDLDGKKAYKSIVSLGPMSETLTNNQTRQSEMNKQIGELKARGNTGLYSTIDAALSDVVANYKPDATNMVVLMTDGKDDPDPGTNSPIDLTQLKVDITKNHNSTKQVPIVTIGLGPEADNKTLQDISRTSGAVSLTSVSGFDIDQVLLSALFGVSSDS